ncbi:MAG: anti-sigma factor domain-containing protein [Bacillota bacterium]
MNSKQGLVVETSKDGITVLTSDGQFLFIPIKNSVYMVGEQIILPNMSGISTTGSHISRRTRSHAVYRFLQKRLLPIAAVASLILCTSFFGYNKYLEARPAVAWVTIDLVDAPVSLELEVNDKGLIKSVTCFDEESQRLASSINLYMKPVDRAVEALLRERQEDKQPEVVIGIIPMEDRVEENSLLDRLEEKILKDVEKAAQKAAKQTAKTAQKVSKEATNGAPKTNPKSGGTSEKAYKEAQQSKNLQGSGTQISFSPASISHIRLDRQTREIAKELRISATRAVLWALFHELRESRGQAGIDLPVARGAQSAVESDISAISDKLGIEMESETVKGSTGKGPAGTDFTDKTSGKGSQGNGPTFQGATGKHSSAAGSTNGTQALGKPAGNQASNNKKEQPGQFKGTDSKSNVPPGQLKKPNFRVSIPKPGLETIKQKSQQLDSHYLTELAKQWAEKVKQAQSSKPGNMQNNSQADKQQTGKSSDHNPGSAKGNNQQGNRPSGSNPGNVKGNSQDADKPSGNKAGSNKGSSNKPSNNSDKPGNSRTSQTKYSWSTRKSDAGTQRKTNPWSR